MFLALFMIFTVAACAAQDYPLTPEEINTLLLMREEEKLARDVYTELYTTWGLRTFSNIASSEQQHMDAVLRLLNTYGVDDPAADTGAGQFTSESIQQLYEELVSAGNASLVTALETGARIEELDISDLQDGMNTTNRADILQTYTNLQKASENHLRSFISQLASRGVTYVGH